MKIQQTRILAMMPRIRVNGQSLSRIFSSTHFSPDGDGHKFRILYKQRPRFIETV